MCSKYSELDDQAALARAGSEQAWDIIFTTMWGPIVQTVRRITYLPRELAEDVAQEAFYVAAKKLDDWDPDRGRFVTWLYVITRSCCAQHRRRNPLGREVSLDEGTDPPSPSAQASLEAIECSQLLRQSIHTLKQLDREILFLRTVMGFKSHEIAAIVRPNISADAVRKRLSETMRKLKTIIKSGMGDND